MLKELISELTALGCRPTGSRWVGGATEKSDWDFYALETPEILQWLETNGFYATVGDDDPDYEWQGELTSWRCVGFKLNILTLSEDYFPVYDYANEQVKICGEDLSTRDKRVAQFEHYEQIYRTLDKSGWKLLPLPMPRVQDAPQELQEFTQSFEEALAAKLNTIYRARSGIQIPGFEPCPG